MENKEIGVICGSGVILLQSIKLEGKKTQNIEDFVRGRKDFMGYVFR